MRLTGIVATLLTGATFGFFFAWVMVMWGLDALEPAIAAAAMLKLNEAVRNPLFFVVFAGAPISVAIAAVAAVRRAAWAQAGWFGVGAVALLIGTIIVTAVGNLPLNESLALMEPRFSEASTWMDFAGAWQPLNIARTIAAGAALGCCAVATSAARGPR